MLYYWNQLEIFKDKRLLTLPHMACLPIIFTLNKVGEEFFMHGQASAWTGIMQKAIAKQMVLFYLFHEILLRIISSSTMSMEEYGLVLMM